MTQRFNYIQQSTGGEQVRCVDSRPSLDSRFTDHRRKLFDVHVRDASMHGERTVHPSPDDPWSYLGREVGLARRAHSRGRRSSFVNGIDLRIAGRMSLT
ncbi:hypothetical protein [Paraburkholderia atlantica]|uniref:hypothetical protein n=1 Tax=Paraburkholderia atlantica TaxID=2654982 RepID=UPI003D1C6DD6